MAHCLRNRARIFAALLLVFVWVALSPVRLAAQSRPPATPVREVTDTYFGTTVVDPYRWLENTKDPEVVAWMKAQNDYTRSMLAAIPGREKMLERVKALHTSTTSVRGVQVWGGRIFYLKTEPGADNSKLYVRDNLQSKERILVDPELLTANGVHSSIDYFQPSLDGLLVAYGISSGGSENSVIHVLETSTGRVLSDTIDRARFGAISWLPGNHSFFYNRLQKVSPDMPRTAYEQRSSAFIHVLGQDPESDCFVFGYGYASSLKIDDNDLSFAVYSPASPYVLGLLFHGTKREISAYYVSIDQLQSASIDWKPLFDIDDDVTRFDVRNDDLYLVTHKHSPRSEVVRTSLKSPDIAHAAVAVPSSGVVIENVSISEDGIYIRDLDGGIGRLRRLSFSGRIESVPVPAGKSVAGISITPTEPGAMLNVSSWTASPLWFRYDPHTNQATDTEIEPPAPLDTSNFESVEVKAKSADGTIVPLSILRAKGTKLDASHPTHLVGYGSYGISLDPFFNPTWIAWLERGGVIGVAHVRGGGEYGLEWYHAGYKLTKQHTVDDFLGCARYMIDAKYTTSKLLSGEGTSAGGILIGGAITQRPELFSAALIRVGVSDSLRAELTPNGPPNIAEFGTVTEPDGFKALYAMDAYVHVKKGTAYPAVLLTAGINDPRVDPSQPAKMTARLQAATSSGKPVLLRVDYDAGHGMGSTRSQGDLEYADEVSFLLWQDGDPDFQPHK
jgi:prolyl oligopeptidase